MLLSSKPSGSAAMIAARPTYRYAAFAFAALLLILLYHNVNLIYSTPLVTSALSHFGPQPSLRVALFETKGCHDEVSSSFFSAFGQMEDVRVDAFLRDQRFGVGAIFDQLPGWYRRHIHSLKHFKPDTLEELNPDIVLSVTSEYDMRSRTTIPTLSRIFHNTNATLFCVVHHPNEIKDEGQFRKFKPWIEAKRIRFITLSDHVTRHLRDNIIKESWSKWTKDTDDIIVSTFPAVFTLTSVDANATLPAGEKQRFAMQGDLIVNRSPNRDYEGTFENFANLLTTTENAQFQLYVLGDGGLPDVPEAARDNIKFAQGLPYVDFYDLLHSATALLPAFANDEYLRIKASSTVPASLIAGSPLIADKQLLSAYTFLDEDDVYLRDDDESEIDAIARIAQLPEAERQLKATKLLEKNARMVKEATRLMETWVLESMKQAGRTA